MSNQWRILVVEDEKSLNRNIVNSLQKDGYVVKGVTGAAEAIRLLWTEKYDVVICDQKMPDADGFELLQWIRTCCPDTRLIMVASAGSTITRTQALEGGVVSYLEKPLDLYVLKGELRRLLQQTGFSASLDSFDLLDLIQIITMSRKTIALVVNIGLEEQGLLRFQAGELIWAECGTLRGEEAFFALAAHKNGTVIHQPWNEQITPNVRQPLSRLIFQALQYRAKYAAFQQLSGEQEAVKPLSALSTETQGSPGSQVEASTFVGSSGPSTLDDSAFLFLAESLDLQTSATSVPQQADESVSRTTPLPLQPVTNEAKEWWQRSDSGPQQGLSKSGKMRAVTDASARRPFVTNRHPVVGSAYGTSITPSTVRKTPASQRTDLPSWLMDQPTKFDLPALRQSPSAGTGSVPVIPNPVLKPSSAEWQAAPATAKTTEQSSHKQITGSQKPIAADARVEQKYEQPAYQPASAEWQPPEDVIVSQPKPGGQLRSLSRWKDDLLSQPVHQESGSVATHGAAVANSLGSDILPGDRAGATEESGSSASWERYRSGNGQPRATKRNYAALVSALQTLGYSLPGFVASAVVSLDGQPIAQVAVDDLDISFLCGYFSSILQGALLSLEQGTWGHFENTVIRSATHHILLRIVGNGNGAFQVLITSHEADPVECLEVMANVEGAIASALR